MSEPICAASSEALGPFGPRLVQLAVLATSLKLSAGHFIMGRGFRFSPSLWEARVEQVQKEKEEDPHPTFSRKREKASERDPASPSRSSKRQRRA